MSLLRNKLFLLFLIFITGFCVRFLPYYLTLPKDAAPLSTPDPHYHCRRVWVTVNNFPNLPVYDHYFSYPSGGYCIWPPLLDFLTATASYSIFWGHPTQHQVEWICAVTPMIYGLIGILLVFLIGGRLFDRKTGYWAALMAAILPSFSLWSRLGYYDHHCVESLTLLLIIYFLIRSAEHSLKDWLALGMVFGAGLLWWQGSILFVGIAFFILLIDRKFGSFIAFFLAFLVILSFSLNTHFPDSPFSYRGLSWLHLSLLMIAALVMLTAWCIQRKKWWGAGLCSIAFGVFLAFLLPQRSFLGGLFFIIKRDPWLATIIEFQPLMLQSGYVETITANNLFGRAYYAWPLMMLIMLASQRDRKTMIFAVFAVFTGLMAFLGRRYAVWFAPFYALLLTWILIRFFNLIVQKLKKKWLAWTLAVIVAAVIFQPVILCLLREIMFVPSETSRQAYAWLRDSTQVTSYYLEPAKKPEYGIMCFWGDGHELSYYSHRPVVTSNFGNDAPNFEVSNRFLLIEEESTAVRILDSLECPYVYLGSWLSELQYAAIYLRQDFHDYLRSYPVRDNKGMVYTIMEPNEKGLRTLISRLHYNRGSGMYLNDVYYPAFRRFRMVYISANEVFKIYRRVKGAVITGRGPVAAPVVITYNVRLKGTNFVYFDSLNVSSEGDFKVVVPYPADSANPYKVRIGTREYMRKVTETEVAEGDTVIIKQY